MEEEHDWHLEITQAGLNKRGRAWWYEFTYKGQRYHLPLGTKLNISQAWKKAGESLTNFLKQKGEV
jgi:hypothetical protein